MSGAKDAAAPTGSSISGGTDVLRSPHDASFWTNVSRVFGSEECFSRRLVCYAFAVRRKFGDRAMREYRVDTRATISSASNWRKQMTVSYRGAFRPWGFPLASWAFAIRIWIAAVVALYLSFWLELESPSSAIVTVAILAERTRGQALEKAAFRLIATIVGVVVSIAITGMFSQTRDLLLIAFAAWLGLCVYLSGLLDGNRAYAAVLSGYTVAFLAVQQMDDPAHVFESSMARGAAIVIGIVSVTIINDVLSAPDRHPGLAAQLADIHRRIRDCAKAAILGGAVRPVRSAALTAEIVALHPEIASLAVESSNGPARRAAAQNAAAALLAELHAVRAFSVLPLIPDGPSRDAILRVLTSVDDGFSSSGAAAASVSQGNTYTTGPLGWALKELMRRDEQVRLNLVALGTDMHPPWRWRSLLYRPHRTAAENGLRSAIWFGLAEAFLAYGGWPAASVPLSLVGVVIGLGAVTPNPLATTTLALIMAPIAGVLAGILEFVILDGVTDFALLAIGLAPLVMGAALLIASPNRLMSVLGRLSLIFTVSTFAPTNPQSYDAQSYVFSFLFVCLAMGLLLAAQLLLPPVSEDRRRRSLIASARRELAEGTFRDERYEPEEEMFRDAIRIGQFVAAGGSTPNNIEVLEEMLSHFDQSTAIRMCSDKLKILAGNPPFATQVRAALIDRDPIALLDSSRRLCAASSGNPAFADLGAALVVASRLIEDAAARARDLKEAA
jgi:uncharacterized membrane protein YccC